MYYEIENDPRSDKPVYDEAGLPACKARAKHLSLKNPGSMVYILATKSGEDTPCGHIAIVRGFQDHIEGIVA